MRIMTFNCNGIRAAARKGFFDWLPEADADVVCLQETKAQIDQLSDPVFHPEGYHCHYYDEQVGGQGAALPYTCFLFQPVRAVSFYFYFELTIFVEAFYYMYVFCVYAHSF